VAVPPKDANQRSKARHLGPLLFAGYKARWVILDFAFAGERAVRRDLSAVQVVR
jgi:hypothetical protein